MTGTPSEEDSRPKVFLEACGKRRSARCKLNNPSLLSQLILNLIDKVDRMILPVDVNGTINEQLLQTSAISGLSAIRTFQRETSVLPVIRKQARTGQVANFMATKSRCRCWCLREL
jgi:hypothetical protein